MSPRNPDVDIAAIGALFGDEARASMLMAMLDRPRISAGELAKAARIAPSTATAHLQKLVDARLATVESAGRLRLYSLASAEVGDAIEALGVLAPTSPVKSLRQSRVAASLREARSCYDHLAGRCGVLLHDELLRQRWICLVSERDYDLTRRGDSLLKEFGIDVAELRTSRRHFARACLDWSHRTPHLAGALGAGLLAAMVERRWFIRNTTTRSLRVTGAGTSGLSEWFGISA